MLDFLDGFLDASIGVGHALLFSVFFRQIDEHRVLKNLSFLPCQRARFNVHSAADEDAFLAARMGELRDAEGRFPEETLIVETSLPGNHDISGFKPRGKRERFCIKHNDLNRGKLEKEKKQQ